MSRLATASPRPPMTEWFSATTTSRPDRRTSARMVASSSGLIVGTCSTATSMPSAFNASATSSERMVMKPLEITRTLLPSRIILALPSSNL